MHPAIMSRKTGETIANANPKTEDEGTNIRDLDQSQGLGLMMARLMKNETGTGDFVDPFTKVHITCSYRPVADSDWSVFCAAGTQRTSTVSSSADGT